METWYVLHAQKLPDLRAPQSSLNWFPQGDFLTKPQLTVSKKKKKQANSTAWFNQSDEIKSE